VSASLPSSVLSPDATVCTHRSAAVWAGIDRTPVSAHVLRHTASTDVGPPTCVCTREVAAVILAGQLVVERGGLPLPDGVGRWSACCVAPPAWSRA